MQKRIAIICGEFHKKEVTEMLVEARQVAVANNLEIAAEIWVNGSYEQPLALKRELLKPDMDAAIVLGIIERGETKHGLVMGHTVMQAILNLELEYMKPVGIGILGPEILPSQIPSRIVPNAQKAILAIVKMMQ